MNSKSLASYKFASFKKCFLLLLLMTFFLYTFISKYAKPVRYEFRHANINAHCVIPDLDPYDEEIMRMAWHPDPITCSRYLSLVFVDSKGFLHYNNTAIRESKLRNIKCSYNLFERVGDDDLNMTNEIPFTEPVYIPADVLNVKCVDTIGKVVYDNLHLNINFKKVLTSKTVKYETDDSFSVYIFGVDSVSRLAAIRHLKKTMQFLHDELGAVIFKGVTKVGDNTFPNVIPMLTGKPAYSKELPPVDMSKEYFDSYPFIWNEFSEAGYATMLAEDWPEISVFNYLSKGFYKQPCDHYLRPFYLAMDKLKPLQYYVDQVSLFLENKNINLKKSSSLCYGNRPKHVLLIDFYKKFIESYKGKLKFAFSWLTEIAHDYQSFLELGDEDFLEFLKWLKREGHLDRSVVLFLSDHGARIDAIRNTASGRVEINMPLFSLVLPEILKKKYPKIIENIVSNTNALTTPYDTYHLLSDILHQQFIASPLSSSDKIPRGISLFRSIPETRSCADANIPESYCSCYSSSKVNVSEPLVKSVALFLVKGVNEILTTVRDRCAELQLAAIQSAYVISSGIKRVAVEERFTLRSYFSRPSEIKSRYQVTFETTPGHALFEGTVDISDDESMDILGDISRTNRYGNQSSCITNRKLKLYCYCN